MAEPNRVGTFPFYKKDGKERKKDFSEVQLPYSDEEARREADRCLLCGTPVCIDACPVLMDVRGMNLAVAQGDYKTAYERIRETNPLLGVTARCCPQLQGLCEDACVLRWTGQPIGIGLIQRFVSDWGKKNKEPSPSRLEDTDKKVAVVGAGPAGLAAAELLRRYGHKVVVYEELDTPGGTAWYGIPDYHLPKDVLLHEIDDIKHIGVEIRTGVRVGRDVQLSALREENDAVLITTGPWDSIKPKAPGVDLEGVIDGYQFIQDVYVNGVDNYLKNPSYDLGKEIIVIGGGDSALDSARTALRLSQGNVTIAYRRTENELPCDPVMLQEAKEEGINFKFLSQPKTYNGNGNHVTSVTMDAMELGEPDESGRRKPIPKKGQEFEMKCSCVILAIGRGPNSLDRKSVV